MWFKNAITAICMPANRKILIIDDEQDLCFLLKDYFTKKKYDVFLSNTLMEGLDVLPAICPHVLFIDNNLPDGLGWPHAAAISEQFPDTYILLTSAFHPEIPKMPEFSRFEVIEKPITLAELHRQSGIMDTYFSSPKITTSEL